MIFFWWGEEKNIGNELSRDSFDPDLLIWCLSKTSRKCSICLNQIIKAFGQDGPWDCARGAPIKSFSCCEEGLQRNTLVVWMMLCILIILSFLFLFVGIGKYMEIL